MLQFFSPFWQARTKIIEVKVCDRQTNFGQSIQVGLFFPFSLICYSPSRFARRGIIVKLIMFHTCSWAFRSSVSSVSSSSCVSRYSKMEWLPFRQAMWMAVFLAAFTDNNSASPSNKVWMTSKAPSGFSDAHATCNGVLPSCKKQYSGDQKSRLVWILNG